MYTMPSGVAGMLRVARARWARRQRQRRAIGSDSPSHSTERDMTHSLQSHHPPRRPGAGHRRGVRRAGRCGAGRQVRARRIGDRDQARPDDAVQRPGVGLRHDRQGPAGLLQDDQRQRRNQRPQDQPDQPRRRLQPAESGRAGAPPGRAGRGPGAVPDARHAEQLGDPQVRQRQEGAAPAARDRRHQVGRSEGLSVDDGLQPQLPVRGPDLRQVAAQEQARREDRDPLPERRLRQGRAEGRQGRPRRRRLRR